MELFGDDNTHAAILQPLLPGWIRHCRTHLVSAQVLLVPLTRFGKGPVTTYPMPQLRILLYGRWRLEQLLDVGEGSSSSCRVNHDAGVDFFIGKNATESTQKSFDCIDRCGDISFAGKDAVSQCGMEFKDHFVHVTSWIYCQRLSFESFLIGIIRRIALFFFFFSR